MLEQRPLLRFLISGSAVLEAPNDREFFDRVQQFNDGELWNFLQTGMAANEQVGQRHDAATARRYGSAGLYVISGGRR